MKEKLERMEGEKGRMEGNNTGIMEEWNNGRMEECNQGLKANSEKPKAKWKE